MPKNIIVGQSGGPTAVINASLAGVIMEAKDYEAEHIYGMVNGIEGFLKGKYVDLKDKVKTAEELNVLCQTPSSYLGSCRYRLPSPEKGNDVYEKLFKELKRLDISALFYIGGNDSMDTIDRLSSYGRLIGSDICFIGIPKTIDNDLAVTDHTPGFGSAAKYVAAVTKETVRDCAVYDLKSITFLEIMGRDTGWLTAAAALAKSEDCEGADIICLPEVPFEIDGFLAKAKELFKVKNNLVAAVSEGLVTKEGKNLCEAYSEIKKVDAFGHKIFSGTGRLLADIAAEKLGCKTRAVELNTVQRSAAHIASKTDIDEAFMAGAYAVRAAEEGENGKMVIFKREGNYKCTAATFDIARIANEVKYVPSEWIASDGLNVTKELTEYIRPLIQGEPETVYKDGLPAHLVL